MSEAVAFHDMLYDANGNAIDFIITDVNKSYEKNTGLKREQVLGKKGTELFYTEKAPFFDIYKNVVKTGRSASFISYFKPLKKHFFISAFRPSKGKFITIFTDISNLKQAEEKFAKALSLSPQGLTITNLDDDKIIEVNNAYIDIFGFNRKEIIGHTSIEMGSWINPEERAGIINILKEKEFVHNKEVNVKNKSGDILTILISAELLDMGEKNYMLSMFYDITDRKKAEKALSESEEKYRTLVDKVNEAIFIVQDGNFVFANPRASELMGMGDGFYRQILYRFYLARRQGNGFC